MPIETKVTAATVASALSSLGVWALRIYVFHGDLPLPVSVAVQVLVPAVVTFAAGWLAKHTPRPDLAVDPVDVAARATERGPGRHELPPDIPSATRYDGPAEPPTVPRDPDNN